MRWILGTIATVALFVSLSIPSRYADLLAMREIFVGAQAIGILPANPTSFWGQILGTNIPLHSDRFHQAVRFFSVGLGFLPAVVLSLSLYHRIIFARFDRRTYCGACGHRLKDLTQPQCPACGESI